MERLAPPASERADLLQPAQVAKTLRYLVQVAGLALAYGVLAWASSLFALSGTDVSPIWLPAGIALAAALLRGPALLPGITLGSFADEYLRGTNPVLACGIALAVTLAAATGAGALRRLGSFDTGLDRPRHVLMLIAVGATVAPIVAAVCGMLLLTAARVVPQSDAASAMLVWALGDGLGVLLLAPLTLKWARRAESFHPEGNSPAEGGAGEFDAEGAAGARLVLQLSALQAAICVAVFIAPPQSLATPWLALATLPIAAILSALLPLRWVAVMNAILFCTSATTTVQGVGPFTEGSATGNYLGLMTYNAVLCVTTLVVAAMALERSRITRELSRSLERFRSLVGMSADWYWEQDQHLRFTYVSPGAFHGRNFVTKSALGGTRFEVGYLWDSEDQRARHADDLANRRPFSNLLLRRRNERGEMRWVSLTGEPVFDAAGRFRGYRGIGRDVTDEKLAETALRDSEARLRSLIALSADWLWEQDENLRYTYFSSGVPQKAGVNVFKSLGKTRFDVPFEWESEAIKEQHGLDLEARRPFRDLKLKRIDDNGRPRYVSVSGEPIFDAEGRFRGYRGVAQDITAVTKANEALREASERFRSLVELSNDWYWEQDEEFRFLTFEGAGEKVPLRQFQQFVGKQRWDLPFLNMSEAAWEAHRQQLREHRSFRDLELMARDESGKLRTILVSGEPIFDASSRFRGYRGTTRDVTAARSAERKAQRMSNLYATLSEANNAIIHVRSPEALYRKICQLVIEHGHFIFCRITSVDAATGLLRTLAQEGEDRAGLERQRVSLDPAVPEGRGPTAEALRSGRPAVVNDISSDPRMTPWLDVLQASSVRAMAAFPLRRTEQVVGALHLYADQPGLFDDDLVALLGKLALNVSFALDNFAREFAREQAEQALRASETRFRDFSEAAAEYLWETDLHGVMTFVSERIEKISGFSPADLVGHHAREFMPDGEAGRVREWLESNRAPDGSFRDLEHRVVTSTGETRWLRINGVAILNELGERIGWRGTGADITDKREADERINYLATRDPLTELPNRLLLGDRLDQAITAARRSRQVLAVMFVDLDRFKNINDSLGHEVGDLVLRGAAARLVGCLRQDDTLARLGGDEFVVVLEGLRQAEDAAQVATKILATLSLPFEVAGHTLMSSCSIGISIFPDDAADERTLMKNADIAMYYAKDRGRGNYQFFSADMNTRALERLNLETALRAALERSEFHLHYQPQVDIRSGRIVGVEALIRWQHPAWGMLPPNRFIPVAEDTGLIDGIGEWTLREACRQVRQWQEAGLPPVKVAVNISARQLLRPREFARKVLEAIEEAGIEPSLLELEMTESLLLQNAEENISVLNELGERQIRIAVDDFGTGYSSLSYLKQLPIDTLKIDRSFTSQLPQDREGMAIVQAIVAMGHSLGLRVTAEGVETQDQLAILRRLRCNEYQGYLFSKPVPADALAELLRVPARPARRRTG